MTRLLSVLVLLFGSVAFADGPTTVWLYPVPGSPPTVLHLHGVSGEVHLHFSICSPTPVVAPPAVVPATNPPAVVPAEEPLPKPKELSLEEKRLEAIRRLVGMK